MWLANKYMVNKTALILHAWFSKSGSNWYPWLKRQLEDKNYKVYLPELPTMNMQMPDLEKQIDFINGLVFIEENTTIIGHSLGCILALRIAERRKYEKLILVAGWDFDDLTEGHKLFWSNKLNHSLIKENVKNIYVISSDNDPYTTAFQAEEMSKRLNGKFILIKHGGHFATKEKCKQLLQLLPLI